MKSKAGDAPRKRQPWERIREEWKKEWKKFRAAFPGKSDEEIAKHLERSLEEQTRALKTAARTHKTEDEIRAAVKKVKEKYAQLPEKSRPASERLRDIEAEQQDCQARMDEAYAVFGRVVDPEDNSKPVWVPQGKEEQARSAVELYEALTKRYQHLEEEKTHLSPSSPGLPWWTGTERDWQTFISPLLNNGHCELDSMGRAVWKGSCGLAGIVSRAAIARHWLRQYYGEESYPAFLRSYFIWPRGKPSKNAFDKSHVSEKDKIAIQSILSADGFTSSEVDSLLELE